MTNLEFWHGSHTKGLDRLIPHKNSFSKVFASRSMVVAALFTAYPRKFSFMVDQVNHRVYIPGSEDLIANDNGGSVYRVIGDFAPASDKLIYEFEATIADVISETEIDSAVSLITSLGFQIYTDSALHHWAYFYQQEHRGLFPKHLPEQACPFSK